MVLRSADAGGLVLSIVTRDAVIENTARSNPAQMGQQLASEAKVRRRFLPRISRILSNYSPVIPAFAGIHPDCGKYKPTRWIPAFAGMTGE
jgi:hypothetical protein